MPKPDPIKALAFLFAVIGAGLCAGAAWVGSVGLALLMVSGGIVFLLLSWATATNGIRGG